MIVPYYAKDNVQYFFAADVDWDHDQNILAMVNWLFDRNIDFYRVLGTFYFKHEKDRTLFVLRFA